jgi:hypothetical protein
MSRAKLKTQYIANTGPSAIVTFLRPGKKLRSPQRLAHAQNDPLWGSYWAGCPVHHSSCEESSSEILFAYFMTILDSSLIF